MMADGDSGEDGDERAVELSALAATYPELIIHPGQDATNKRQKASLEIQVEPIEPISIQTPTLADGIDPTEIPSEVICVDDSIREVNHVSHLPPLTVEFSLPVGYPSDEPPVVQVHTQGSWLAKEKLQELEDAAHNLWEDVGQDQVLFTYVDHLREASEEGFGIRNGLEVSQDMKIVLLDYDLKAKRAKFEKETFDCGVCLEPKKGSACHRLTLCSHVFCVDCLQDFYNNCISEGDVGNVKCLAPKCEEKPHPTIDDVPKDIYQKVDRTLEPSELLQIPLEQEVVQRYVKLKRKRQLESDRNTVYCPRQWCQGPARCKVTQSSMAPVKSDTQKANQPSNGSETDDSAPPLPAPADRLAICEDCSFAFCLVCKASWHGEYFTCIPRSQFEITAEERASEEYMQLHTQPCPTCDARAQKTHGCNHMICFKCDTHFCYLCGSYLERGNPYEHFNNKTRGCYMRLWELEGGDDGEIGHAFAGGQDGIQADFDSDEDEIELLEEEEVELDGVPAEDPLPRAPLAPQQLARPLAGDGRPARLRGMGAGHRRHERDGAALRRFLEMARDDIEDEWDSDDMSGDEIEGIGRLDA